MSRFCAILPSGDLIDSVENSFQSANTVAYDFVSMFTVFLIVSLAGIPLVSHWGDGCEHASILPGSERRSEGLLLVRSFHASRTRRCQAGRSTEPAEPCRAEQAPLLARAQARHRRS